MKIKTIRFKNHPFFGNLELDFTDSNGKAINTIIIAGDNGVGKSLLLKTIFEFNSFKISNEKREEYRDIVVELSDQELHTVNNSEIIKQFYGQLITDKEISFNYDFNILGNWTQIKAAVKTSQGILTNNASFITNIEIRKIFKSLFSDVEINFNPKEIKSVTAKNVDSHSDSSEKSDPDLATGITQLLIDIQSLDALDLNEWARLNVGKPVESDRIDIRMRRFTSAFNNIFPSKRFKRIENQKDKKVIVFEEFGREMNIEQLSSGEKQIVFRGSFLLKDKESSKGALILIDEPEISLHPSWQLKILNFFKMLFTNETGEQTSQIIVTTHSPFIIHNANRINDKVIVLQKDSNGKIVVSKEPKFFTWSTEKIIQEAFRIDHITANHKIIIFVEGETDEMYFRKALHLFSREDSAIEFKWIGRINDRGQAENTGDTALNQARTFFTANPNTLKGTTILLYDNDTNKQEEKINNLLIRRMPKNDNSKKYKAGIENLLNLPDDFDYERFYKESYKADDYGAVNIIRSLDKMALCKHICESVSIQDQKTILANLNLQIERFIAECNSLNDVRVSC